MAADPIWRILTSTGYPADLPRVYLVRNFEDGRELDSAA